MDVCCTICGEPWDNDCFHEEAAERGTTYRDVTRDFQSRGCRALETAFGPQGGCQPRESFRTSAMDAMFDLLGDDIDGAASMMDDLDFLGMLD